LKKQAHRKTHKPTDRLHLDKRAEAIAVAVPPEASDDDLLTTLQVANWFGVSTQWLEIGRVKNYGPPWLRVAPQMIRYNRGALREWLKQRAYRSTADYPDKTTQQAEA